MKIDPDRKLHLTVPDAILCELGKIVVFQVILESTISNEITKLLNLTNEKGQIVTSELSFKQLIALLSSLIIEKIGDKNPLYLEFKEIKKQLYEFENFRNTVAHSIWAHDKSFSDDKAIRMKVTSKEKKGLNLQNEEIELTNIIKKLEAAGDTQVKLALLMSKITEKKIDIITMN
jgi:hypothetical protein